MTPIITAAMVTEIVTVYGPILIEELAKVLGDESDIKLIRNEADQARIIKRAKRRAMKVLREEGSVE